MIISYHGLNTVKLCGGYVQTHLINSSSIMSFGHLLVSVTSVSFDFWISVSWQHPHQFPLTPRNENQNGHRDYVKHPNDEVSSNFLWFVFLLLLFFLGPRTIPPIPLVIWHCRRRQAFRAFFVPGERRRETGGEAARGRGAGGETMPEVPLCSASIRAPPPTLYTHTHTHSSTTSQLTEGAELRAARQSGVRGRG